MGIVSWVFTFFFNWVKLMENYCYQISHHIWGTSIFMLLNFIAVVVIWIQNCNSCQWMEILDLIMNFAHNYICFKKMLRGQTKMEHHSIKQIIWKHRTMLKTGKFFLKIYFRQHFCINICMNYLGVLKNGRIRFLYWNNFVP